MLGESISDFPVYERNAGLQLEWGLKVGRDTLRLKYVVDYAGLDLVRALAACQEKSTEGGMYEDFVAAKELGVPNACDTIWHRFNRDTRFGKRGDDVFQASMVDALAEPLGAIACFLYSPPEEVLQCSEGVRKGA